MGTAMASMASGQQAGSSRERSDVADLEKQLVPLIRKWWDERIRHHEHHWSVSHPNTLLRNKNTPFFEKSPSFNGSVGHVSWGDQVLRKAPSFFHRGAGTMRSHSTYEFVVGHWTTFGVESWVTRIPTTARAWWCPGSWRFTDLRIPGYPPGN